MWFSHHLFPLFPLFQPQGFSFSSDVGIARALLSLLFSLLFLQRPKLRSRELYAPLLLFYDRTQLNFALFVPFVL